VCVRVRLDGGWRESFVYAMAILCLWLSFVCSVFHVAAAALCVCVCVRVCAVDATPPHPERSPNASGSRRGGCAAGARWW
jgi:hypothetical protein